MTSFAIQDVCSGVSIDFPEDERLRRHGFRVALRPRRGEATWKLGNVTYSYRAALQYCRDIEAMCDGTS